MGPAAETTPILSQCWRRGQRSNSLVWTGWSLRRPRSSACRRPSSPRVPPWPSSVHVLSYSPLLARTRGIVDQSLHTGPSVVLAPQAGRAHGLELTWPRGAEVSWGRGWGSGGEKEPAAGWYGNDPQDPVPSPRRCTLWAPGWAVPSERPFRLPRTAPGNPSGASLPPALSPEA